MVASLHERCKLNHAGKLSEDLHRVNVEMQYESSLETVKHSIYKHRLSLKDFFRKADSDNSGNIDLQEFTEGLRSLGIDTSLAETIFDRADSSHDGLLQYNEVTHPQCPHWRGSGLLGCSSFRNSRRSGFTGGKRRRCAVLRLMLAEAVSAAWDKLRCRG